MREELFDCLTPEARDFHEDETTSFAFRAGDFHEDTLSGSLEVVVGLRISPGFNLHSAEDHGGDNSLHVVLPPHDVAIVNNCDAVVNPDVVVEVGKDDPLLLRDVEWSVTTTRRMERRIWQASNSACCNDRIDTDIIG